MANTLSKQIMVDGGRNFVVKVDFDLDTSNLASTAVVDPSTMSAMTGSDASGAVPNRVKLMRVDYSIQDPLGITLTWDATTQKHLLDLAGRGHIDVGHKYGGIENNAAATVTGKINAVSQGYTSGTLSGTLILHCVKQRV